MEWRRVAIWSAFGVAAGLALFVILNPDNGAVAVVNSAKDIVGTIQWMLSRGLRLSSGTLNSVGDIIESPDELAAQATATLGRDVSSDAYAVARMLASEEPKADADTKVAIAWVLMNVSGGNPVGKLTADKNAHGSGRFGIQTGRYASTRDDPYESDLQVAEAVLSGTVPDPTNGAVHFYRPTVQNLLFAEGKVRKDADQIDADWGGNGYNINGVDEGIFFYT